MRDIFSMYSHIGAHHIVKWFLIALTYGLLMATSSPQPILEFLINILTIAVGIAFVLTIFHDGRASVNE